MKKIFTYIILAQLAIGYFPYPAFAADASLYLAPDSVTSQAGTNFTINVGVNSGGNSINAIEATVNIPGILGINSAGTGGSLCSIWVQQPTVVGSTVSFKCGIPGGTTASGNLASISLNARTVGTGTASITAARVLAGPGTNVTGGTSGGTYTVTPATTGGNTGGNTSSSTTATTYGTPSPTISSATHPDQNAWYKNNSPAFSWNKAGGITGFSYVFDQSAGTTPNTTVDTSDTGISFQNQADGVWYLHIRANGSKGWSNTSHYRIQIDATVPTGLEVVTEPKVEADKRPMVSFNAVDATSGIDHYEIKLDKGEFQKVSSPYTPDKITSGDHVFTVRAYDKAGNMVENTAKIKIKDIQIPKITKPSSGSIFKLAQALNIAGTADASTLIDVYFDGVNIARSLKVGENGTWQYQYQNFIMPGKHKIIAVAVKDGIESKPSQEIGIRVDPSAISIFGVLIPSYIAFAVLIAIIVALALVVGWLFFFTKRKYDQIREKIRARNKETKAAVEKRFDKVEDKLRGEVQDTYEDDKPKTPKEEHSLEDKLDKDLSGAEADIKDAIEKEFKDL